MKKMWEGRFHKETNKLLEKFNASITFDKRMYEEDITGSIAHSRMLAKQGIIAENEQEDIENGHAPRRGSGHGDGLHDRRRRCHRSPFRLE